jgi:hypothetical protein
MKIKKIEAWESSMSKRSMCDIVAKKTVPMFGCFGKTDLWKIQ